MYPEVVIHNSVSPDHAVRGFDVDLGMHYGALLTLEPGALLAGSATAKSGIELFMDLTQPGDRVQKVVSYLFRGPASPHRAAFSQHRQEILADSPFS